jgi:hypothetical protein
MVALVWLFGAAQELRASCGDYVTTGGEHAMVVAGHFASPRDVQTPAVPAAGCHGPNCQRQTPAPTGPTRDLPIARSSERACRAAVIEPPLLATARFAFDSSRRPLDGHQRPIEHPPRLAG